MGPNPTRPAPFLCEKWTQCLIEQTTLVLLLKKLDRSILEGESIQLFRAAIRSKHTLEPYERRVINFLNHVNMKCDDFAASAKESPASAEKLIVSYILAEKKRVDDGRISSGTAYNVVKAVKLLLEMNDVALNWKKIKRMLPRQRRYALDRIPTIEELRKIINASDLRGKALTYTLISSGIREGAVETLKVGHLTPIRKDGRVAAARLVAYAGDPEQYITFISAEGYEAIEEYLEYRRENGEKIGFDSPLFRDRFDVSSNIYSRLGASVEKVLPMTARAIRHYYNRLLHSLGIRNGPRKRHEFSVHSFRKWFKTRAEQVMKPINVEILMGHSVGISDSYYRPTENELLEDYLKAASVLTVSHAEELKHKLVEQESNFQKTVDRLEAKLNSVVSELAQSPRAARRRVSDGQGRTSNSEP